MWQKLWTTEIVPILKYNDYNQTIDGYRVLGSEEDDFVIVAMEFVETDIHSEPEMMQIATEAVVRIIKRSFKEHLQKLGLWNEKEFGIWVVTWS